MSARLPIMGVLSFQLPADIPPAAESALPWLRFVGGYDRTPFPTALRRDGLRLEIAHDLNESGYIGVPWPVDGWGWPVTVTATLREQNDPYKLLVELARGKLNQVRNATEEWKLAGLEIPVDVAQKIERAMLAFGETVVDPDAPTAEAKASEALRESYRAGEGLVQLFLNNAAKLQQARIGRTPPRWSCNLSSKPGSDEADLYLAAFDTVQYVPRWNEIEPTPGQFQWAMADAVIDWATGQGRTIIIGPLIDLGSDSLPAWLNASDGDVPTLAAYFCDFVETMLARYRDRVRDWVLCTGFNYGDIHNLTQDDRLRLVVRLLEAARAADPDSRYSIGVSQPWGEYLDQPEQTLSPLVFCDTLLRTGLSISGFCLEVFASNTSRGSQFRDGMEIIRLLELFGLLGVPIEITCRHAGRSDGDPLPPANVANPYFKGSDNADMQAEWGGTLAALAATMQHIRGITWGTWKDIGTDAEGLLGPGGEPKPLLFRLRHLRTESGR